MKDRKNPLIKEQRIEPMTLEECGTVLGVTRERVRQIEANALRKLRNGLARKGLQLKDFVGGDHE